MTKTANQKNFLVANLTQHLASEDQKNQGVFDLSGSLREKLQSLLTFNDLPSKAIIDSRAAEIAALAENTDAAMIGGAPYLMGPLEAQLKARGITPLYAFSQRVSVDEVQEDGSVKKTAVFKHLGFVKA